MCEDMVVWVRRETCPPQGDVESDLGTMAMKIRYARFAGVVAAALELCGDCVAVVTSCGGVDGGDRTDYFDGGC